MGRKKVKFGKYVNAYLSNDVVAILSNQKNKSGFIDACIRFYIFRKAEEEREKLDKEVKALDVPQETKVNEEPIILAENVPA